MTSLLFFGGLGVAIYLVYFRAYRHGYKTGMLIGIRMFEAKLPKDAFRSICEDRVREIDDLLGVKQ
jgi:hypothetical protein